MVIKRPIDVAQLCTELVGLSEVDAIAMIEQAGCKKRVTRRDGVASVITADHTMNRVNLRIESGIVTYAAQG